MAKEYIERNAAIEKTEAFCDVFVTQWTDEKVLAWIRNLPAADVVEVVRCKDCEAWQENPWSKGEMVCKCWVEWLPTEPDDFCSYGERRTNDGNKENL